MVGTKAIVRPRRRTFATARRSAGRVRITCGGCFACLDIFMTTLQREHTRARFVDAALRLRLTYFDRCCILTQRVAHSESSRNAGVASYADAGGARPSVLGACDCPRERKRRLRQVDHGDARRRRTAASWPAGRHDRSRFAPKEFYPLYRQPPRVGWAHRD